MNEKLLIPIIFLNQDINLEKIYSDMRKDVNFRFYSIVLNNYLKDLDYNKLDLNDFNIIADGGANFSSLFKIDYVCGDLDSIDKLVLDKLIEKGIKVEKINDENTTDLEKCLITLENLILNEKNKTINLISVIGTSGGRFDQTYSNISNILKFSKKFQTELNFLSRIVSITNNCFSLFIPNVCVESSKSDPISFLLHDEIIQKCNNKNNKNIESCKKLVVKFSKFVF